MFVYVDNDYKTSTHLCILSTFGVIGRCVNGRQYKQGDHGHSVHTCLTFHPAKTLRGDLSGGFSMQLRSSRRNTMSFVISGTSTLPTSVGTLLRSLHHPHTYRPDTTATHKSMIAGSYYDYLDLIHILSTQVCICRHRCVYVDSNYKTSMHLCILSTCGAIGRCG